MNLLRFLQEKTIERVGGTQSIPVDVRVIAASHVDLDKAVAEGRFREDLYYRLNVLHLRVPPLRERESDIELLARFFFDKFAAEKSPSVKGFSQQALQVMSGYAWPGNVRELINRVRRAMVMCENRLIGAADLGLERRSSRRCVMTPGRRAGGRREGGDPIRLAPCPQQRLPRGAGAAHLARDALPADGQVRHRELTRSIGPLMRRQGERAAGWIPVCCAMIRRHAWAMIPAMDVPVERAAADSGAYQPIAQVRAIQRELCRGTCAVPARELMNDAAWQDSAQLLTRYYFPQWVRKDLDEVEVIEQIYRHALYWYPLLSQFLPWAYPPAWHRGTLLDWLAQAVDAAAGRCWLASIELADRGEAGVSRAVANVLSVPAIKAEHEWLMQGMDLLWRAAQGGGPKGRLAALVYDPLAYADADADFVAEAAPVADSMSDRARRPGSGPARFGYVRLGRLALLIGNGEAAKRQPDLDWIDLREGFAEVLDYRLRCGPEGALEVTLRPAVVDAARARLVRSALGIGSPAHKLRIINDILRAFEARHRWAGGAQWQFTAVEHEAQTLLRQHIVPAWPQARGKLYAPRVRAERRAIEPNPFLQPTGPESAWLALFSPYR